MHNDESRARGPAPESTSRTTTSTLQRRCDYTDEPCRCQAEEPSLDDCQRAFVHELTTQLRRRREASWRIPTLVDGRRDPLGPVTDGRSER